MDLGSALLFEDESFLVGVEGPYLVIFNGGVLGEPRDEDELFFGAQVDISVEAIIGEMVDFGIERATFYFFDV